MLIENDKMLLKNEEVAKEFNQCFGHISDSLDLFSQKLDDIDKIYFDNILMIYFDNIF